MSKALVLIVDDEEGIRETLAGILEDEGYETMTASSGEEAEEKRKRLFLTSCCWTFGLQAWTESRHCRS